MTVVDQRGQILPQLKETAVALGFFDGIHIGHQSVIKQAAEYAKQHGLQLAVFTFTRPVSIKGKRLVTLAQKHRILEELKVEFCFEPSFYSFHSLTPGQFYEDMLRGEYHAKALFCGEDFAFGANRGGNVALLSQMCRPDGVHLGITPTTYYKQEPVSSSRIRATLQQGDIEDVNEMLGRPYEVELPVRHGAHLGTKLGFPTINQIYPDDMQTPKDGVYITDTWLNDRYWPSSTGYGNRPTVNGVGDTCETFVPGYTGDVYGQTVRVRFYKYVSEMIRFDSLEELTTAVQQWAQEAVDYFK